ncbi:hypothetical protein BMW23_0341 [Bodo saltans virus]|uniref:Uncharacterized protein n=1 Tax=Bodo saltans virus TaxID=2024608 RepID=A0A2H4UU64_9VIRU|nr:hypothetical protein QJ851_gp0334 [Bodo saltans virus]ATZ80397.1 hypothetical protein BMW23_0341 [Bodo saltans virus]
MHLHNLLGMDYVSYPVYCSHSGLESILRYHQRLSISSSAQSVDSLIIFLALT